MRPEPSTQPSAVDAVLEVAAIRPERCGRARTRRLREDELALYRWLLRRFADDAPPTAHELADAAVSCGVELERAVAVFADEDLVHLDPATGVVRVAYPFSGTSRGHRVLIDGQHRVEAMCAIDALGIAAMVERPIELVSRDPVSGGEVWVRLDPGDGAWWEPETAVVLAGSCTSSGPSFRSCCRVLNLFESGANALQYLVANGDVVGHAISIPEAIAAGRAIFGNVLKED